MSDITAWPWPRIIASNYKMFLVSGSSGGNLTLSELFYSSADYWGTLPVLDLGMYADISEVSIADFDQFYVVCTFGRDAFSNPVRKTYVRDLSVGLGYANAAFTVQTNPICGTCCNYNGQFLGGNLESISNTSWSSTSARSILWSSIGNFELDPANNIEAGNTPSIGQWPMRQNVHVYKLKQLGNSVAAYTDAGLVMMQTGSGNSIVVYGQTNQPGLGVLSGNHVAGDNTVHGFIDIRGDFWTMTAGGELNRRGYREFIRTILDYSPTSGDGRTIVSYIPNEQTFAISNGNECLMINRFGAWKTHQMIGSMVEAPNGATWGTFITGNDTEARITTDRLDFGSRGTKSLESLMADISHPAGTIPTLSVDWRKDSSAIFTSRPWMAAGPIGRAGIHTAGQDFRLRARFSSFTNVELFGLMANVKYSDQRFKRGTVPAQYEVGTS